MRIIVHESVQLLIGLHGDSVQTSDGEPEEAMSSRLPTRKTSHSPSNIHSKLPGLSVEIYSRSSCKWPPREFEKVVVTRAGRLQEYALVSDPMVSTFWVPLFSIFNFNLNPRELFFFSFGLIWQQNYEQFALEYFSDSRHSD